METRMKIKEMIQPMAYVSYPKEWPVSDNIYVLQVSSCKHFKNEGIRKGGYIGIDPDIDYEEGKLSAYVKFQKGESKFKLSRKPINGYEYAGRLALVISFPCVEV